jgi:hypothetical protein
MYKIGNIEINNPVAVSRLKKWARAWLSAR